MNDRDFLIWVHERLVNVHGEDRLVDYMHKFRAIINSIDKDRVTENVQCLNSIDDLRQEVEERR